MNRRTRCSRWPGRFTQFRSWFGMLAVVVLVCGGAIAQKDTGGLAGVVKDPSGALVAGAKVRVADIDRGAELTTTSNAQGEFVFSPLKIGRYQLTAEKAGF